ncbi:SPOR domain-containing protein [Jiella sonneratiae]|uniref:SPOR domain-containing protein n=1 Tax=Jiella sonneratiae TaxID=2816856 RepID=A0ABS3IXS9_9HYPH|nr:SPOR domain-containing protein [Jiella sonneratiae]MBO0902210.1 SPOR domain-containing protein [Jiella sonneratiae]
MSLGNHNGSARTGGRAFEEELDDPFEELARILEAPMRAPSSPAVEHSESHVAAAVEPAPAAQAAAVDPSVGAASTAASGQQDHAPENQTPDSEERAPAVEAPVAEHDFAGLDEVDMSAELSRELSEALELAAADFGIESDARPGPDAESVAAPEAKPVEIVVAEAAVDPAPIEKAPAEPVVAAVTAPAVEAESRRPESRQAEPLPAAAARGEVAPQQNQVLQKPVQPKPVQQNAGEARPAQPKPVQAAPGGADAAKAGPAAVAKAPAAAAAAAKPNAPAPAPQKPLVRGNPVPQPAAPAARAAAQAKAPAQQPNAAKPAPAAAKPAAPKPETAVAGAAVAASAKASVSGKAGDFDFEFEQALRGLSEPANPRQATIHRSEAFAPARQPAIQAESAESRVFDDFDELIASELAAIQQEAPREEIHVSAAAADAELPEVDWPQSFEVAGGRDEDPFAGYGEADDQPSVRRAAVAATRRPLARSGFVGAGMGALALMLAAGGAYWFLGTSGGVTGDGSVLIVRADPDPVKVKPENPGGREIPNQNKIVYSRVENGDAVVTPAQKELVSAEETPLDLPTESPPPSDLPGVELGVGPAAAAEQIETASAAGESRDADAYSAASPIAVLSPRRTKTYSVRADGTLVVSDAASGDTAPRGPLIEAAARPVELASNAPTGDVADDATGAAPVTGDVAAAMAGEGAAADTGAATEESAAGTPAPNVPIPTIRPPLARSDARPVETASAAPIATPQPGASEPEPIETASLQPAPASPEPVAPAATHDGYYVQISSQPSREAAETSSRNLGQRYAGVIAGRSVVIQSAEIPGKGTYYRVRVPVDSKSEAGRLCSDLKSAGGSCFVSR